MILMGVFILTLIPGVADAATLERIRLFHDNDTTRVVLDLSDAMDFDTGNASDPSRFYVDLFNVSMATGITDVSPSSPLVSGIRTGRHQSSHVRVVLDLDRPLNVSAMAVGPDGGYGHRVVIDVSDPRARAILTDAGGTAVVKKVKNLKAPIESKIVAGNLPEVKVQHVDQNAEAATNPVLAGKAENVLSQTDVAQINNDDTVGGKINQTSTRDRVIVVDPGHGGKDPGAIGHKNTYEKEIVLSIAKIVATEVNKIPGYRAILTREDDTFVALRERAEIARKNHAYAFISIHADGSKRAGANGTSVYSLTDGAKTNARTKKLAEHMNANDVVQGDSVGQDNVNDRNLVDTLMALSTAKTQELGFDLGTAIMQELKKVTNTHTPKVEKANFRVLLAPGVPTILVETGFITNPKEEKLLRSKGHQKATAKAIVKGLRRFLKENESKLTNAEGQQVRG